MLVIGDSHVRRINEFMPLIDSKLRQGYVTVDLEFRGGSGLSFAEERLRRARGYDIVIIMVGGNDLDRGATHVCFEHAYAVFERLARQAGIRSVIITSLLPRQDPWFNTRARQHFRECWDRYYGRRDSIITFWQWDLRQPFRTIDGVHLERPAYRKAVKSLLAPILWVVNRHI